MKKKVILGLFAVMLSLFFTTVSAYGNEELNRRLISCTPSKNFKADSATMYQISGLTGSTCIYRIQFIGAINKSDLICKVPKEKMPEMTSFNPIVVQNLRNRYCVISINSHEKPKDVYF